ncbi:MAG: glutaredoxin family protein [Deltaproteobacteria bacterium]|nr:glutaredoxin family protein [Deltaproteobacteria bacterium]
MRVTLKCLVLSALILAAANCSTTTTENKIQGSLADQTAPAASYPKIVLYTTAWCPYCKQAKEYLTKRKIPFTNLDVGENERALDIITEKYRATSVPVIVIGNDEVILQGFNPETFEKALRELKK